MLTLSDKWAPILVAQSETGMGYQIAHVLLVDGTQVDYLVIVGGVVTEAVGSNDIPFSEDQIVDIRVTHGKLVINSAPFTENLISLRTIGYYLRWFIQRPVDLV
jgi:hypothetical protein